MCKEKKRKRRAEANKSLDTKKEKIADIQTRSYISVSEAAQLIGVSKSTVRRMVRRGMLVGVNLGIRLTRIDRTQLEQLFTSIVVPEKQKTSKVYELDKCYTIGECLRKYNIPECRLESIIRAFNIPKRKVVNYVYIPRVEIDKVLNKID
ncbi:helix-turn-helix domain-containing protein [Bacteroides fragilis]|nr:helix-turn-helix domain-containing protein [Bacteroides fragilis]